jgi:hypothetical protein
MISKELNIAILIIIFLYGSDSKHIIIALLTLILINMIFGNRNNIDTFASTSNVNMEAINNLASMYRDGVMTVPKIKISGDLEVDGNALIEGNSTINGNSSIGGDSEINGNASIEGDLNVKNENKAKYFRLNGAEIGHIKTDGIIYRHGGQVYIGTDDNLYIRTNNNHNSNGKEVRVWADRLYANMVEIDGKKIEKKHVEALRGDKWFGIQSSRGGYLSDQGGWKSAPNGSNWETMYLRI